MSSGGWFEYNGRNSKEFHLKIENDVSFPSPEADVEFIEVLGKDGEVAIDNKRLKGVRFPIPVVMKLPEGKTVNEVATEISNWLKNDIGWYKLRFSGQKNYYYVGMMMDQYDVAENLKTYGRTVIPFRLKPIKYADSNILRTITNGATLVNPHSRIAEPYLKITGSGNITFKNNGVDWLKLEGVDGYIEVDSEVMETYKGDLIQALKHKADLDPLYPLLNVGENIITWTGNVSKVEINERWGQTL